MIHSSYAQRAVRPAPCVIVVDDDGELRESVGRLLRSVELDVRLFGSVPEFLGASRPEGPCCLLLDVRLPGQSGLHLQDEMVAAGLHLPIIFMTGYGDIPMSVQAMKSGAVDFLTKPFRDQDLLDAIKVGLDCDQARLETEVLVAALKAHFDTLTARERQIMAQVARGRLNKQIAADIGVSEATVKVHRSNMMRKMRARSLTELGQMANQLNLAPHA